MAPLTRIQIATPRVLAPGRISATTPNTYRIKDVAESLRTRSDVNLTVTQSETMVKDVLDIVQDILLDGDDVMLRGETEIFEKV